MGRGLGGLVGRPRSFIPQTFMASTLPGPVCPWGMNGPETMPRGGHSLEGRWVVKAIWGRGLSAAKCRDVVRARAGGRGRFPWTSLKVQCLRLRASSDSTAGGTGSNPPQGTKIPHAKHDPVKKQIIKNPRLPRGGRKKYRRIGRHGQVSCSPEVADWSWGWEQVGQRIRTEEARTSKGTGLPLPVRGFEAFSML